MQNPSSTAAAKQSANAPAAPTPGLIAVARIIRPRGRRGEVLAEVLTDFPARFETQRRVLLENKRAPSAMEIESAWLDRGRVVLKFQGVDTISQAEPLRGLHVLIPRQERAPLAAHQYYVWELRGCSVWREAPAGPQAVGRVEDVLRTPGGEILRVSTPAGEVLIPFAQAICKRVDLEAKVIVIDPPEDLLGLNSPRANPVETPRQGVSRTRTETDDF